MASPSPFRRALAAVLHGLMCLITPVPSHRSSQAPCPEPGQSDAWRQLLLRDPFPSQV